MSKILHRNQNIPMPLITSGKGVWVRDNAGTEYLDAVSGGAAVSCLGHGEPRVAVAISAQLEQIAYAHGSFFSCQPAEALAEILLLNAPDGMNRVLFSSGGSEAIEAAIKLVRQTWLERGQPKKTRFIARHQSYHGATIGALSISGNKARRETYAPLLFDTHFIEPCYSYRQQRDDETESEYGLRAANALEDAILEVGPENVAAFIAEPVVGATLGCAPAVSGYLKRVRQICDQYDVLLILDEIMCGSGRTGKPYACLDDNVCPDLITIAKGLGGGYQPIGAVLVGSRITEALSEGSGLLRHGYTYMGHPVACAAALAVQQIISSDDLLTNVKQQGSVLRDALQTTLGDHPNVGDIRGRGLFLGIELVADKKTKEPFDPAFSMHAQIKRNALAAGLMVYPGGGTIDGHQGDHILLAPAYTITENEIHEIVRRLEATLNASCKNL